MSKDSTGSFSSTTAEVVRLNKTIISWPEENIKTGLRGENVYAKRAIVDLTLRSMPNEVVKISGFDVFTHAVETTYQNYLIEDF